MYSFKKEVKFLDDTQEEKVRTYEFFTFTQNLTNPNVNKYTNYGEVFNYSLNTYNNDFLGLNVSINNLFYIEYVGNYSENYELYDGAFLIYKNMNNPFDNPADRDETIKREMPVSPREEEKVELKSVTYQTGRNAFSTLYYFPGSVSGLNNLKASLTLPKELQIREFLNPREITQEDFNTLINDLEEEKSMEDLQEELYKIVDDDGVLVEFRLLSYTKNNLINKVIDYSGAIKSIEKYPSTSLGSDVRLIFNTWFTTNTLPALRIMNFTNSSITEFNVYTTIYFYLGRRYNSSSYRDKTLQYTYDGYDTLRTFYPNLDTSWNGGLIQDYRTNSQRFSSTTNAPEISISNTNDRIFLINSYNNNNI